MWIFVAETFCNANIDVNEKRENEKLYLTKLLKTLCNCILRETIIVTIAIHHG